MKDRLHHDRSLDEPIDFWTEPFSILWTPANKPMKVYPLALMKYEVWPYETKLFARPKNAQPELAELHKLITRTV